MTVARIHRVAGQSAPPDESQTGLNFPSNGVGGGDIRLVWSGGNLLSRNTHTAIWKANYTQQTGYYASWWHSYNDGTFHGAFDEFGTHPYPGGSGSVNGSGQGTDGQGSIGTVHQFEIAGIAALDWLATAGGSSVAVTKGQWYTHARQCELISGTTLRHRFYLDLANDASQVIVQDVPLSSLSGGTLVFYIGGSRWTGDGNVNTECPSGLYRGIQLYSAALSLAQIQARMDLTSSAAVVAADPGSLWYSNLNPTPSDITDKSSAGHTPSWANANRPTLWTP